MIDAAIAGLGRWGRNLVNAVHGGSDRLHFSRCVVRRAGAAREFAAEHGLQLSTDLNDVLTDKSVQAVVFATPHSLRLELEAFAEAVAGRAPYPIPPRQMIDGTAALEAAVKSIELETPVVLEA